MSRHSLPLVLVSFASMLFASGCIVDAASGDENPAVLDGPGYGAPGDEVSDGAESDEGSEGAGPTQTVASGSSAVDGTFFGRAPGEVLASGADFDRACPVVAHEEQSVRTCAWAEGSGGTFAVTEESYGGSSVGTLYRHEAASFAPVLLTEEFGFDHPDASIRAVEPVAFQSGGEGAILVEVSLQIGEARAFDVVAWDESKVSPRVVAHVDGRADAVAVVVAEGVRIGSPAEDGRREVRTLRRLESGDWENAVVTVEVPEVGHVSPAHAVDTLYRAWTEGDIETARSVAPKALVADLFTISGVDADWTLVGCEVDEAGHACGFAYEGGFVSITVEETAPGNYVAVSFTMVAD